MHALREVGLMAIHLEREDVERKTIRVSKKRQITIPLEYYKRLDLGDEVECSIEGNAIVIRPVRRYSGDDFSVEILNELVSLGYSGQELVERFEVERANLKKAARKMIEEADRIAGGSIRGASFVDVFETED